MEKLRAEILELSETLEKKKQKLFLYRLSKIAGDKKLSGLKSISIEASVDSPNNWSISYEWSGKAALVERYDEIATIIKTKCVDETADDECDITPSDILEDVKSETENKAQTFKIEFGKNARYYLKGRMPIKIYRNNDQLRIYNEDHQLTLDFDQQKLLCQCYSEDDSLPEWFAIKVFLHMANQKWTDEDIVTYLSVV